MEQQTAPHILSGTVVRDVIKKSLTERVGAFSTKPILVIIQVGDREDSNVYIKQKINFGESIGVQVVHRKIAESATEEYIRQEIQRYNDDDSVTGVIIQLPLPAHIHKDVIEYIAPEKDVDCLTQFHQHELQKGNIDSAPATPKAILKLLSYYNIDVNGKHVVVVGRSTLVGRPTAQLLEYAGAQVSVLHSQSVNPEKTTQKADVLVVACGVPGLVTSAWIDPGKHTTVIDVGIHRVSNGLIGDVDIESVKPYIYAYSPVPGGVGPLTVACLFEKLVSMHTKHFS